MNNDMIRKFWIYISLSALTFLSIVGIGFSFWTFHKVDSRQDLKFNVFVTETALAGSMSVPNMPIYAVLDEGVQNANSSITGVAFYKGGKMTINGITFNEDCVVNPDLTFTFTTNKVMTESEVNGLKFGMRLRLTGKLTTYLRKTAAYYQLKTQDTAPNDANGDYIDLKAFAQTTNFDGTTNYSQTMLEDGRWKISFHLSTQILNSFFTYQDGKRPLTKSEFMTIKNDLQTQTSEPSSFIMDLWQGV